jgi:hypothetical protein
MIKYVIEWKLVGNENPCRKFLHPIGNIVAASVDSLRSLLFVQLAQDSKEDGKCSLVGAVRNLKRQRYTFQMSLCLIKSSGNYMYHLL